MTCGICGRDDGLYLMCGRHWSEYVSWCRDRDVGGDDGGGGGVGVGGGDGESGVVSDGAVSGVVAVVGVADV